MSNEIPANSLFANPLELRWDNSGMAIKGTAMNWNTRVSGVEKGPPPRTNRGCTQFVLAGGCVLLGLIRPLTIGGRDAAVAGVTEETK